MERIDYAGLRREQADKRARGELMGVGISSFTEIVGAGPSKHFDILGLKMFDSCEIRVHPTGKAIARFKIRDKARKVAAHLWRSPRPIVSQISGQTWRAGRPSAHGCLAPRMGR